LEDAALLLRNEIKDVDASLEQILEKMPSERTLVAALALNGLLSDMKFESAPTEAADTAVKYADALLRRLAKQHPMEGAP
jgi:hypothetical protein